MAHAVADALELMTANEAPVNEIVDVVGERFRREGITKGKARAAIRQPILDALLRPIEIEADGHNVRLSLHRAGPQKTAQWLVRREKLPFVEPGNSENQLVEARRELLGVKKNVQSNQRVTVFE